ncbi:MAG: O-antigen ligase family protein [Phycisphaerae bacterium]|nr:O-antigen ligase family protein [Phycisphaerae bacterium]
MLIVLAFAVPLWVVLCLLTTVGGRIATLVFLGGLFLVFAIYGMKMEYFLILWFAAAEFNEVLKWMLGVQILGIGVKGVFFVAVLSQLPNKFSLMPRRLFRSVPVRWPLYLLLLWVGASILWSDNRIYGIKQYLTWVMSFFTYSMVYLTVNERNRRLFLLAFALMAGSSVLFGLAQRFGLPITFLSRDEFGPAQFLASYDIGGGVAIFRATGFAGHPNMFGRESVLEFCVLMTILISWRPRFVWRMLLLGMLGVTLAVIVLTYSRVAWVLFAASAMAFIIFARPRWLIPMAFAVVVVVIIAWPQIWARLEPAFSGTDSSLAVRGLASRVYMESWKLQPFTGYGFGSTAGGAMYEVGIVPHEGYVFLLSFLGIIGLVLFVGVLLALTRHGLKVFRDQFVHADLELRTMAALGLGVIAMLVVDLVVQPNMSIQTWYLLGVAFAARRIARSHQGQAILPGTDALAG